MLLHHWMYLSFWLDIYILKIQIKLWEVWDHWLHPCTCHSPWHRPSGSKWQGFTQPIQVKLKWRFGFPETDTLGKQKDKSINLSEVSVEDYFKIFLSYFFLLVAKNLPSSELKSLFWDINEQTIKTLAAIFYHNEVLLLHIVKTQFLHASTSSP